MHKKNKLRNILPVKVAFCGLFYFEMKEKGRMTCCMLLIFCIFTT